jgi:hypothetical protein
MKLLDDEIDEALQLVRRKRRRIRAKRSSLNLDDRAERIAAEQENGEIAEWLNTRTRSDGSRWSIVWTAERVGLLRSRRERRADGEDDGLELPVLGEGVRRASDQDIARCCKAGDRDSLAELFLGEVNQWAWDVLEQPHNRRLQQRKADLHEELVAVGALESLKRAESIVDAGYTPRHVRNSLRQSCKAKMRISLDQLPLASASSRTLRDRRERERDALKNGEMSRRAVEYRPADMPPLISAPWSGYFCYEPASQIELLGWQDNINSDPFDPDADYVPLNLMANGLQSNEPIFQGLDNREKWLLLAPELTKKALELCVAPTRDEAVGKKLRNALLWMLEDRWNKAKREWRAPSIRSAAKEAGMREKRLREELDLLSLQVAYSLTGLARDLAVELLGDVWPEILEVQAAPHHETDVGTFAGHVRAALNEVDAEVQARLKGPLLLRKAA